MDTPPSTDPVAAAGDQTLGRAAFVTLRVTVFGSLDRDLPLQQLQEALHRTNHWDHLCRPFRSFHKDIVVPHATEGNLPLVVLCEPFQDTEDDNRKGTRVPHRMVVEFAPKMTMVWEGTDIEHLFSIDGYPLCVTAHVVDSVAFFESGIIAYSLAFMFGEGRGDVDLNAQQLLAIGALVNSAGQLGEEAVKFVASPSDGSATRLSLQAFVQDRLSTLAAGRDMFGDGPPDRTVFTMLNGWAQSLDLQLAGSEASRHSVTELQAQRERALALRAALASLHFHVEHSTEETSSASLAPVEHSATSIGIEVIGAQWHERVLDYAAKASRREARVDDFSLRLAGLAQNVFDFNHQDHEEVNDSLASAARIGTDITFVQRGVAIRFMEQSRAFMDMRCVLGGSPCWLLVQLVLGHNESLLSELNSELVELRQRHGLSGMIREFLVNTYMAEGKEHDAVNRLQLRFLRRLRLAHYIPNIFRYPTEQLHYELFARARGLDAQHDYLTKLDATIEQTLESTARGNCPGRRSLP